MKGGPQWVQWLEVEQSTCIGGGGALWRARVDSKCTTKSRGGKGLCYITIVLDSVGLGGRW